MSLDRWDPIGVLFFWLYAMATGSAAGLTYQGALAVANGQWVGLFNLLFFGLGTILIANATLDFAAALPKDTDSA